MKRLKERGRTYSLLLLLSFPFAGRESMQRDWLTSVHVVVVSSFLGLMLTADICVSFLIPFSMGYDV